MKGLVLIGLRRHLKLDQIKYGRPTDGVIDPPKQQLEKMGAALGIGEGLGKVLQPVESLTQSEHLFPSRYVW